MFIEYAKAAPDDIRMRVTVHNRGADAADIHVLPHIWFRNTWSWAKDAARPELTLERPGTVRVEHPEIGSFRFDAVAAPDIYFCENETNAARVFGAAPVARLLQGRHPRSRGWRRSRRGQPGGARHQGGGPLFLPGTGRRARHGAHAAAGAPGTTRGATTAMRWSRCRRADADRFYAVLQEGNADADQRLVQRQALAGMIWSKQFYYYDINGWLTGDPAQPPPPETRSRGRNADWRHLNNADVISMPDKWEYPWYAAWDLAFHCLPLAMVDAGFAKRQLLLMTREWYMHPSGQLPAYEWALGDVNPPVHAWAELARVSDRSQAARR